MSILFGIYDPHGQRRRSAINYNPPAIANFPWLVMRKWHFDHVSMATATGSTTPLSFQHDASTNRNALVLGSYGENILGDGAAASLLSLSGDEAVDRVSGQTGYYLAVLAGPGGQLLLGTDVLAHFPLYYWQRGDVLLFGSSPAWFWGHPLFSPEPNPFGIASLLLLAQPTGGQTTLKGVRRNAPGHIVQWDPVKGVKELEGNPLRMSDAHFGTPYPRLRDHVHSIFLRIVRRVSGVPRISCLLSGGQDSRLVAGYLAATRARESVTAFSLGGRRDRELAYAAKAASVMGWRHVHRDVQYDEYVRFVQQQLELEQLGGTIVNPGDWTAVEPLRELGAPFLSGFLGDAVIGETSLRYALRRETGEYNFETLFAYLNQLGFPPEVVKRLLAPEFPTTVVDDVIEERRQAFHAIEGYPYQKAWLFGMMQRQRFHVAAVIWRLSLAAWPLLPYLDRDLLETAAGMPLSYFEERRIQTDLLKTHFHRLAKLPLDRSSLRPSFIIKPLHRQLLDGALDVLGSNSWQFTRLRQYLERRHERRYYYRVFDFNNDGWVRVRRIADGLRGEAGKIVKLAVLDELLPRSHQSVPLGDAILDGARLQTLTGLLLWNGLRRY